MAEPRPLPLRVRLLRPGARLPQRATAGATGLDLCACPTGESVEVGPDPVLVPTGIAIEVPGGYDAQVRPRSGLARRGVMVVLGTIDADYRGEVLVTMFTVGGRALHRVRRGDRIAQLVVAPLAPVALVAVEELSPTERGAGGHGSTGA
ncbi:MAG: dUTP diphosphatase [Chloroflexi bacterium]|nr:dUTP diphosphatase [Chloroflexota bacterium]